MHYLTAYSRRFKSGFGLDRVHSFAFTMLEVITLDFRMFSPTIFLLILVLLLLYLSTKKPKGYPPGPKWWPILGSAMEVARLRKETGYLHKTCSQLCKEYGPVIGLKIGKDQIIVLNNYESIKSMLSNEECDGRPIGLAYEARTWGERRGVLLTDGNVWIEQRRFVMRHLRELGFGKNNMAMMVEDEAMHFVKNLEMRLETSVYSRDNIATSDVKNNGKIYQLIAQDTPEKKRKLLGTLNADNSKDTEQLAAERKSLKIEDMYVKGEDYDEVRKASKSLEMVVQMDNIFGVPILNTLWRMMAGKRFSENDKDLIHLQRMFTTLLKECDMIGCFFGNFPILRYIAPEMSGYKKFVDTHHELWTFLNNELAIHKKEFDPNKLRDLMDAYLKVLQSDNINETFSEIQLLAICVDLFIAGSETTSKALDFCFLYLVLYPDVQRKAQEEIDREIGRGRFPRLSDRPRLPYVNAVGLEAIRMFMGRTLNVPHRALKDTYIMGHRVPKDTMLVTNFNGVLMDESWGDPEVFRPERFLDNKGNISLENKYMPFSIGKHRCMGEVLAKSNVFIFTAALLQAFTFSVVPGEAKPTVAYTDGVTAGPIPFRVLLSKRL